MGGSARAERAGGDASQGEGEWAWIAGHVRSGHCDARCLHGGQGNRAGEGADGAVSFGIPHVQIRDDGTSHNVRQTMLVGEAVAVGPAGVMTCFRVNEPEKRERPRIKPNQ
jgi:hypothetical protein